MPELAQPPVFPQAVPPEAIFPGDSGKIASSTVWDGDPIHEPQQVAQDRKWGAALMVLLGRLEVARNALAHSEGANSLKIAAGMVSDVVTLVNTAVDPAQFPRAVTDALATAGRFLTAAQPPRRGLFGAFAANAVNHEERIELLGELPVVLEQYFALLGTGFRASEPAIQWIEASGVFLSELRTTVVRAVGPILTGL
jgi:hypothetical protein